MMMAERAAPGPSFGSWKEYHPLMTLELAEALLSCGELRREDIPDVAAELLAAGTDTPTTRVLAGLVGSELSEAHELFVRLLSGLGRTAPTRDQAATSIARGLASQALAPGAHLRRIAGEGARLASVLDYHRALLPFYEADAYYDCPDLSADVEGLLRHSRKLLEDRPSHNNPLE
jgi:hypothetical protein